MSNGFFAVLAEKIKEFWQGHDQKILTAMAIVLVAVASFQAGQNQQRQQRLSQINVNLNQKTASNPAEEKIKALEEVMQRKRVEVAGVDFAGAENAETAKTDEEAKNCVLVGSKNSNKYHQPGCSFAAKIKPKNRVCFSSVEDAKARGYVAAGCCNK